VNLERAVRLYVERKQEAATQDDERFQAENGQEPAVRKTPPKARLINPQEYWLF
jgi:hypothetical protein